MRYKKINLPKDGSKHNRIVEWWYFNGHLKDKNGNKYAYMDCLFRADTKKVNIPFLKFAKDRYISFAHSIFSDINKKKVYTKLFPMAELSKDSFTKPLFFVNYKSEDKRGYLNYEIEEIKPFHFRIKTDVLDLELTTKKRPLLEGGKGFMELHGKDTYYYSLTNLETSGTVKLGDKTIEVKGKSWMDHQWADIPYEKDKWTWFSIQLDNDSEMVCFEFDDGKKKEYLASLINNKGKTYHTKKVFFSALKKYWKSSKTGASYPLHWEILIPSKKISLKVSPLSKSQEVVFGNINYWEGPLKVSGRINNKDVRGRGYMELVGYPQKKSFLNQRINEIKKKVF